MSNMARRRRNIEWRVQRVVVDKMGGLSVVILPSLRSSLNPISGLAGTSTKNNRLLTGMVDRAGSLFAFRKHPRGAPRALNGARKRTFSVSVHARPFERAELNRRG